MKTRQIWTAAGCREALVVEVALGERNTGEGDIRGYIAQQLESWFADVTSGDELRPNAHSFGVYLAGLPNLYEPGY